MDEPETADLQRVVHAAEVLDGDPSSPTHLRAFAWRLVAGTHSAAGWDIPANANLSSCRAAADSLSHASSLLISDVAAQIHGIGSPVLLLGGLAESRSVFGRWDLLPANGAVLVSFDRDVKVQAGSTELPAASGVRWASPGDHRGLFEKHATPVTLNGDQVLVPRHELVAARIADRTLRPEDPAALIFCGAALAAITAGNWAVVMRIAKRFGRATAPIETAVQLGLDGALGLEIGRVRRSRIALRRLFRR